MKIILAIPALLILVIATTQAFAVLQNSVIGTWDVISRIINGTITYYPNGTYQETILKEISKPVDGTYRSVSGTWTLKGSILTECLNTRSAPLFPAHGFQFICFSYHISGDANNLTLSLIGTIYHLHRHASF
jgi:hypothetical protein